MSIFVINNFDLSFKSSFARFYMLVKCLVKMVVFGTSGPMSSSLSSLFFRVAIRFWTQSEIETLS